MDDLLPALFTLVLTGVVLLATLGITVLATVLPFGILFLIFRASARARAEEQALLATGTPAPATITGIGQTGIYMNHQPQVQIELEVAPPDGPTFTARVTRVLSLVQIPQVQPGRVVEVRYDPANPARLAIVGL